MDFDVTHYPERYRFEVELNGYTAYTKYVRYHNYLDIVQTYVPREIDRRGLEVALVEATYKYALENRMKPQATCSYAVSWLKNHPEYMK